VIGSLAGIAEIAKSTFGGGDGGGTTSAATRRPSPTGPATGPK
jgi:hypothetical protein